MTSSTVPTDPELAGRFRVAMMRCARRLRLERADDNLTLSQTAALATLARHGPMSVGELAQHEHVQPPSMTRIVSALQERGLISRVSDPADRRVARVALTDAGSERLAADRRRRTEWLHIRISELEPDERERLRAVIPVLEKLAQR